MTIEYDNLTPLYDQVRRFILADLDSGRCLPGDYLPPEPELCAQYAVSRITLRRAVADLCADGRLRKMRGKGTLVLAPKVKQTLVSLSGFTESLTSLGHAVRYSVIESDLQPGDDDIGRRLCSQAGDRVVRIWRLLIVDDVPLTLEDLYVLERRFGRVVEPVLEGGSFDEALRLHYHQRPGGAERTINVGAPASREHELLECAASQPVYRMEKLVFGRRRDPIAFSRMVTPCDRVIFLVTS
jgi:DNA-binding GntR family transcriptional regulator